VPLPIIPFPVEKNRALLFTCNALSGTVREACNAGKETRHHHDHHSVHSICIAWAVSCTGSWAMRACVHVKHLCSFWPARNQECGFEQACTRVVHQGVFGFTRLQNLSVSQPFRCLHVRPACTRPATISATHQVPRIHDWINLLPQWLACVPSCYSLRLVLMSNDFWCM
jgi:hypothetical protein